MVALAFSSKGFPKVGEDKAKSFVHKKTGEDYRPFEGVSLFFSS